MEYLQQFFFCYVMNKINEWEQPYFVKIVLNAVNKQRTTYRRTYFITKSITRSLIIFKKPRKMTNDFFNHYIFVRTFQWTSSECLNNVTITVKVAMVTYIHCKNGLQNLTSEAYLEAYKHLRQSFLWEQFMAEAVNWFHKKLHFRSWFQLRLFTSSVEQL